MRRVTPSLTVGLPQTSPARLPLAVLSRGGETSRACCVGRERAPFRRRPSKARGPVPRLQLCPSKPLGGPLRLRRALRVARRGRRGALLPRRLLSRRLLSRLLLSRRRLAARGPRLGRRRAFGSVGRWLLATRGRRRGALARARIAGAHARLGLIRGRRGGLFLARALLIRTLDGATINGRARGPDARRAWVVAVVRFCAPHARLDTRARLAGVVDRRRRGPCGADARRPIAFTAAGARRLASFALRSHAGERMPVGARALDRAGRDASARRGCRAARRRRRCDARLPVVEDARAAQLLIERDAGRARRRASRSVGQGARRQWRTYLGSKFPD